MAAEDYIDMFGHPEDEALYQGNVECRQCGKAGLHWEEMDDGKWALFSENYERHKCDPKRVARNVADDFEVLE